jgi:hypothetical protein
MGIVRPGSVFEFLKKTERWGLWNFARGRCNRGCLFKLCFTGANLVVMSWLCCASSFAYLPNIA